MISMKDIANAAGVSRTTVSFVLNGHSAKMRIGQEVIDKVRRTASEMKYVKNELARSVITGKVNVVAILTSFSGIMLPIIQGYAEAASKHRYSIKLIPISAETNINIALKEALEYRVAGIIGETLSIRQKKSIDPAFFHYGIPSIGLTDVYREPFSNERSTEVALHYLYELGHRKIFCLDKPTEITIKRSASYEAFMAGKELPFCTYVGEESFPFIVKAKPDAVFCTSDGLAFKLLHYLYLQRIFVPEAFSVCGFGGTPGSELAVLPLTTVAEPYYETGVIGFENLYNLMQTGDILPPQEDLVAKLLVRESTAPNLRKQNS